MVLFQADTISMHDNRDIIFNVKTTAKVIKLFFMLNSMHEILNAPKYKNIKKFSILSGSDNSKMLFSCSYMLKCQQN